MKQITLCRILGTIFIISGVAKAFNVNSFAYEVRLYADTYFWDGLSFWATPIAVTVCAIEIFFGPLAFRPTYQKLCSVFLALQSFFSWLTVVNYFDPTPFGRIESCGCFGELIHFSPLASVFKSTTMWAGAFYLLIICYSHKNVVPLFTTAMFKDSNTAMSLAIALLLPLYSLSSFDAVGHLPYGILYFAICTASVNFLVSKGNWLCTNHRKRNITDM